MKVIISKSNVPWLMFENKFYKCGEEIEVSFDEALRLSVRANVEMQFVKKEYDPSLWKEGKTYGFSADVDNQTGYGNVTYNLLKYSHLAGHKIAHIGRIIDAKDVFLREMGRTTALSGMAMVWHDQPRETWEKSLFSKNIAITPFETTLIPQTWIPRMNRFDAMFVPCKQNIEAYQASGLKIPIELIHWGVEEDKFYPLERNNEFFTFGHLGALSERKGTDLLIPAFVKAFPTEKDVRLICKTSYNYYPFMTKDKRVIVHMTPWTNSELIENFYKKIDCFVFPTRGEGFGMTPLEAMATGVPTIVTGWSGPMEYMKPEIGWTLDYKLVPATNFNEKVYKEECGNWAEPSMDDLIDKLRYAYNHREEVKQKGLNAAEYVKKEWLWKQKISLYHEALNKHL